MSVRRRRKVERRARRHRGRRTNVPRATVSMEPQLHHLKSCPPDGFIQLRRMSYGELMASQDMMYQVQVKADADNPDQPEFGMDISRAAIMEYQFQKCILDHNLEDESGRKLDFRKSQDIHLLDSNVGQEIASAIDDIHNWKKQYPNSETPSGSLSSTNGQGEMAKVSAVPGTLPVS